MKKLICSIVITLCAPMLFSGEKKLASKPDMRVTKHGSVRTAGDKTTEEKPKVIEQNSGQVRTLNALQQGRKEDVELDRVLNELQQDLDELQQDLKNYRAFIVESGAKL